MVGVSAKHVLRVVVEGMVTSFLRKPFIQDVQITYEMPPPSTLYGHICSAVGELIPPTSIEFGYTFTHGGQFEDYEHLYFPETSALSELKPFVRHLLFEPRLTLYLCHPDLEALLHAFQQPYYVVTLGRSQDLMTYISVEIVTLQSAEEAYFEGTLLPPGDEIVPYIDGNTIHLTMARYIDETRAMSWASYAMLRGKARFPADGILAAGAPKRVWVDPEICAYPSYPDLPRAVWFHSFVEASDAVSS